MLVDFHTHSSASDGALSPRDLLQRARQAGVTQFAITDHDTLAGCRAALCGYNPGAGETRLVAGVELSCVWSGVTVHVVGLGIDLDNPELNAGVESLQQARLLRADKIAQRLEKLGYANALAGARAEAGSSQLGRPHFARWMVAQGHVKDANEAFKKYLGAGKCGDVKAYWPQLAAVTGWIVTAGGTAVLAHPLKYKLTRMKLRRLVRDFVAAGGTALEVLSGRQAVDQTRMMQLLATEFGLLASVGSDFHRDSPWHPGIGVEAQVGACRGVWEQLQEAGSL